VSFIHRYILSIDTFIGIVCTAICVYFLPDWIEMDLFISLLEVGIGVLSIVFSIFFAALAFIMSSSDDDFVKFLETNGHYSKLINTFRFTVLALFVALFYSIIFFIITTFCKHQESYEYIAEIFVLIFCFLFFYSLIATILSTLDAIKYSENRIKFLIPKQPK